jgi:hypothetical protein
MGLADCFSNPVLMDSKHFCQIFFHMDSSHLSPLYITYYHMGLANFFMPLIPSSMSPLQLALSCASPTLLVRPILKPLLSLIVMSKVLLIYVFTISKGGMIFQQYILIVTILVTVASDDPCSNSCLTLVDHGKHLRRVTCRTKLPN